MDGDWIDGRRVERQMFVLPNIEVIGDPQPGPSNLSLASSS